MQLDDWVAICAQIPIQFIMDIKKIGQRANDASCLVECVLSFFKCWSIGSLMNDPITQLGNCRAVQFNENCLQRSIPFSLISAFETPFTHSACSGME